MDPQMQTAPPAGASPSLPGDDLPPGNHPLEIAARRGFGPLSPVAGQSWHGDAKPCPSCGQLVRRHQPECEDCGQDLRPEMMDRMRAHAGPWYVFEHIRPFPGVTLERIIRQIHRGVLTATSIVRGPATDHQWRFVAETPGLCRYFGVCWHCHAQIKPTDLYCGSCAEYLDFDRPRRPPVIPPASVPMSATSGDWPAIALAPVQVVAPPPNVEPVELRQLKAAVAQAEIRDFEPVTTAQEKIAGLRPTWIAAIILVAAVIALIALGQWRQSALLGARETPVSPAVSPLPSARTVP